jgi:DNA modification methylase
MLTKPGDMVADIFSGSNTTGYVAERLGRRWLSIELDPSFASLSAIRFLEELSAIQIAPLLVSIEEAGNFYLSEDLMAPSLWADLKAVA